jgi:hypothetical protein
MSEAPSYRFTTGWGSGVALGKYPSSGTADDDDNRDDEHAGENEAAVREHDERIEAPEEFATDDEDALPGPGDDSE